MVIHAICGRLLWIHSVTASFTINLGTASPFNRLAKTWNIDSTKTNATTLALVNPEVDENMRLTFSKN